MAEEAREVREARPVWETEVPWVVAYLREDIQDLKGDIREMRRSIERLDAKLSARIEELDTKIGKLDAKFSTKIEELDAKFSTKIEELDAKFTTKIEELDAKLTTKIGELDAKFTTKIDGLDAKFDAKIDKLHRDMGIQLRWIIGIVIGVMLTMTGVFAWIVDRMLTP